MDDDYIYKQINTTNNIDNYTYKFIESNESGSQEQLSENNNVPDDIFNSDICSEINRIELWVDLCYALEGVILICFTLVVIKIIHYKKLRINETVYDDLSDFESNSFYSFTERTESLPSVVGPNLSVNIKKKKKKKKKKKIKIYNI